MKSIASVLSIIALGLGLLGCPGGGAGAAGSTSAIIDDGGPFGVVGNAYSATLATTGGTAPFTWTLFTGVLPRLVPQCRHGCRERHPDGGRKFDCDIHCEGQHR